jgi:hypothetical protein
VVRKAAITLIAVGIALNLYIFVFTGVVGVFTILLFLFSSFPYLVCLSITIWKNKPLIALGGSILPILSSSLMYYDFINSTSSTAAIGLGIVPLFNLIVLMPIGMLIGYLINRHNVKTFLFFTIPILFL